MARDSNSNQHEMHIPAVASDRRIGLVIGAIDQLARVTRPKFYGLDRVTGEPAMFVGNHTIYGVFDVPFMVAGLRKHHGLAMRSLGDHRHWAVPGWREFLETVGAVRGTRANVAELMRRREPILVFPGGAREVNKRRGEKYKLIWKSRIGFTTLAIEHGYPIVPFAAVGGEEVLDVLLDDSNAVHGQVSKLLQRTLGVPLPSLVRGIGLTPLPRPQRFYFWFGDPIDTTPFQGDGAAGARHLRDQVKREVEGGIEFLLRERDADPGRKLLPRLLGRMAD